MNSSIPKRSLAFTLDTDDEVDNFFNVYRIYRKTPYYEELKKDIERLEEKKEKLTAEVLSLTNTICISYFSNPNIFPLE